MTDRNATDPADELNGAAANLTLLADDPNLFSSAASVMPGSTPDVGEGDPRAEGDRNDPHPLPGVSASTHQAPMTATPSFEAAHAPEAIAAFACHPEVIAARQAAVHDQLLETVEVAHEVARHANDTAVAMREWALTILLQLADVARDGVRHLDLDDVEVARAVLQFIADAPKRLGIAPESGHAAN